GRVFVCHPGPSYDQRDREPVFGRRPQVLLIAFDGMSAVLTAMSENLPKGVEGKIKGGLGRFPFLVSCQHVSRPISDPG
ncbi:MAG: hypothetical protein U1A07_01955, partial [Phenylobacterium sp.]|nr:hypothetical protein [Phenylobacterium sp.]